MGHMEHTAVEWREINPDYIVSSDGQVGSRKSGGLKILRPTLDRTGYPRVHLCAGGSQGTFRIHRLVAKAFLPPRPTPGHEINHKDGDRTNNRDANLEWVTRSGNQRHRFDVLKHGNAQGEANGISKLTEAQIHVIRARCAAGEVQRVVAADYGITQAHVSDIYKRKKWGWLGTKE